MDIIVLVIFRNESPPKDLYHIPARRLYCLERDGNILVWTLYRGTWRDIAAFGHTSLPTLYRDWSCIGADLIYDQVEFERACKELEITS